MNQNLNRRGAVYTGTFDPVHVGHVDLIRRGSLLFERLIVGVGVNPEKAPLFTTEERMALLREVCKPFANVEVREVEGLTVRFVREAGARVMMRGLRTLSDMEFEFTLSLTNRNLDPEIETICLMASEEFSHVNSTMIRQIAEFQGDLSKFLPPSVKAAVEEKVRKNHRHG